MFNAVHKAQISWKRIRPLMQPEKKKEATVSWEAGELCVNHLTFTYPDGKKVLDDVSFTAKPGEIIGITGTVASGKSTLGKVFLCEYPYEGGIYFAGNELRSLKEEERIGMVGYMGHDPELFCDTIEKNIKMGEEKEIKSYLEAVCLDQEVAAMEERAETLIGSGGVRLSGGQAQRLSLARTLYHKRPIIILDDPFSALDKKIKCQITKYQMCMGCLACESVCAKGAISIVIDREGMKSYKIHDSKCVRCGECIGHFDGGCYMRRVMTIKR